MAELDEINSGGKKQWVPRLAQDDGGSAARSGAVEDRNDSHEANNGDEPRVSNTSNKQVGADADKTEERQERSTADEAEALLVEQARNDPAAFGAVYERYVDRIYAYIFHRVGSVHDAEDLTARTFYRALDRLDTYEDRGLPFSAWLFRIAHNLVANWYRDRSRRRFLSLDRLWFHSPSSDTPEEKIERDERHDALWAAIKRLPKDRQNLLLYKFGSVLTNIEIGELMGKSESAIKSLYFRTLAALRTDLESRGWDSSMTDGSEVDGSAGISDSADGNSGDGSSE